MQTVFAKPSLPTTGTLVVGVLDGRKLSPTAQALDKKTGGALTRAMAASRFEGKKDQTLVLLSPTGLRLSRVLLLGLGKTDALDDLAWQALGGKAVAALQASGEKTIHFAADSVPGVSAKPAQIAAHVAFGAGLRAYRFDKYRTQEKPEQKPALANFTVLVDDVAGARRAYAPLEKITAGVFFTRDLVSEPANVIYPESLAAQARSLRALGVTVEILGEKQMKKLGMGALLGVGQGSARESQLVVLRWNGGPARQAPIAFVGKGVTFDSGGISIKPAAGMEDMKWDMGGAGAVIGAMKALAGRKAKVNAVGICGLVENMPSGAAQRPGDVVTSMSGQTIEVINTDAEGRLVLADALYYCQKRFKPKAIIDLATLTGAIIISLGSEYAGLFSNNDDLAQKIAASAKAVGEPVWRLPLGEAYDKQINSDIADMKNTGGREGGSITAAQFLQRFIKDTPWAHLDIAGRAWSAKDASTTPKGATGYGVRLLDRLVADCYEAK